MRSVAQQDLYEVLEVPSDATPQEIERAYQIARHTYQPGSIATYSVFSDEDNAEILRRVEEAYQVLSDESLRREYDARLRRLHPEGVEGGGGELEAEPELPAAPRRYDELELDEEVEPDDGIYDGLVLRRIRMSRGVEIEEISAVTKISETYLGFLEANRYADLPAPVYVRGFLQAYARYLRLDARAVTASYMERYRQETGRA